MFCPLSQNILKSLFDWHCQYMLLSRYVSIRVGAKWFIQIKQFAQQQHCTRTRIIVTNAPPAIAVRSEINQSDVRTVYDTNPSKIEKEDYFHCNLRAARVFTVNVFFFLFVDFRKCHRRYGISTKYRRKDECPFPSYLNTLPYRFNFYSLSIRDVRLTSIIW